MRLSSEEDLQRAQHHAWWGGIKGGIIGLSLGSATAYYLHKKNAYFAKLTPPIKAFFLTASFLAGFGTASELSLVSYERAKRDAKVQINSENLSKSFSVSDSSTRDLPIVQEKKDYSAIINRFLYEYRYPIVIGVWASGMTFALFRSFKVRHLKFSQKLIHARMEAQALTIGAVLGLAYLTSEAQQKAKSEQAQ